MQWDSIYSRFQKNLNIFIFLIYSVVSVVTLEAFNCNPPGLGLLTADLRELCPENGSFLIVYSIIFILVYPIGIPLFVLASVILIGVPALVQDKRNAAMIRALCNYFIRKVSVFEATDLSALEMHTLGEFFGDDIKNLNSKGFERRMEDVYRKFVEKMAANESDRKYWQIMTRFIQQASSNKT